MPYVQYPSSSPYAATPQLSWRLGNFVYQDIPPDSGDLPFTLQQQHEYRPDRLSYDLYGTPVYWWVFCMRNPALRADPVWNFIAGLEIMVPTSDYLRRILGT